jgi:hypothetical protein
MAQDNILSDTKTDKEISSIGLEEALKLKRDALLEQIRSNDALIAELQAEFATKLEELQSNKKTYEEMLSHIQALLKIETKSIEPESTSKLINDNDVSITDSAFSLLQESHLPMHYKDIASTLKTRGLHISGVDPAATLLSRMSRDDRFKRVKRGTYGLKGWRRPKIRKRAVRKNS